MRSSGIRSTVLTVLGVILLVISVWILGSHYFGHGRAGQALPSATLPPGLRPGPSTSAPTASGAPKPTPTRTPTAAPVKLGVPVRVVSTDHHLNASVTANRLNPDKSLFVPADPTVVSWGSQQVAPGSAQGTIILVAHINFGGVAGAFFDLDTYRVGQVITVVLKDGRRVRYAVAAPPVEVNKDQVGARRQELFDQTHSYGLSGKPRTARLLLLSCGGVFDNRTGHYESNILVYALPI